MCMFSRPVTHVVSTNIFARRYNADRQFLVYEMSLSASEELAMILPIPVPKASKDDAVHFLSLEDYPGFFADMQMPFIEPAPVSAGRALGMSSFATPLPVVGVGSFEASFVPGVKDFDRLDARFQLPEGIWDQLPLYRSYGFAVFKLKPNARTHHPMAFDFPTTEPERLFFPTVHVHDGTVHPSAHFDHALFCQRAATTTSPLHGWKESFQPASLYMKVKLARGILDSDQHLCKKGMVGDFKNEDILV